MFDLIKRKADVALFLRNVAKWQYERAQEFGHGYTTHNCLRLYTYWDGSAVADAYTQLFSPSLPVQPLDPWLTNSLEGRLMTHAEIDEFRITSLLLFAEMLEDEA